MNEVAILDVDRPRPLPSLGDIPLIVLTKTDDGAGPDIARVQMALQQELADLSTNSEFIVVEHTGHYIQIEQPEAVIEAVNTLVASLQNK